MLYQVKHTSYVQRVSSWAGRGVGIYFFVFFPRKNSHSATAALSLAFFFLIKKKEIWKKGDCVQKVHGHIL